MRIVIDPGHGGQDPGALSFRPKLVREADLVYGYCLLLQRELTARGYPVHLTRTSDYSVSLENRCEISNALNADLFVSLHANAAENAGARGFEVFTSPGDTRADHVAQEIVEGIVREQVPFRLRADREDGDDDREARFYVLLHTKAPAVLVELGFLSNEEDARALADHPTAVRYAAAIAGGICRGVEAWGNS